MEFRRVVFPSPRPLQRPGPVPKRAPQKSLLPPALGLRGACGDAWPPQLDRATGFKMFPRNRLHDVATVSGLKLATFHSRDRQVMVIDFEQARFAMVEQQVRPRSEERRVGNECVRTCSSRLSAFN